MKFLIVNELEKKTPVWEMQAGVFTWFEQMINENRVG